MEGILSGLVLAQAAAGNTGIMGQLGQGGGTILMFGLVFVIFYFLIIRPQNKKQKEAKKMIDAVKKGDSVVTIGGVHGEVSSVKDGTVVIKVDDNCRIEFSKSAIAAVTPKGGEKANELPADKSTMEKTPEGKK
jgi:preprotein translocase subunit YajC